MKILFKTALDAKQFKSRERISGSDGYEIHLGDFTINKEALEQMEKEVKIEVIHLPLNDKAENFSYTIENLNLYEEIFDVAQRLNATMVMHLDTSIKSDIFETKEYQKFIELIKGKKLKFSLENISPDSILAQDLKYNYFEIFSSIIPICKKVNDDVGFMSFVPLLDTCHYFMGKNIMDHHPRPVEEMIEMFIVNKGNFHISYLRGDGIGKNHGLSFKENPEVLKSIIEAIQKYEAIYNRDSICTLELREEDILVPLNLFDTYSRIKNILED